MNINVDIAVIGGGPAGMAAALSAYENGIKDILIIERDTCIGGILRQCVHAGFGLHVFNEELTGPEYAQRYIDKISQTDIQIKTDTMVLSLKESNGYKVVTAVNSFDGLLNITAKSVVLAMGCRERTRGMLRIPGSRPAGIFTAGTAQRYVNIEGYMPGREVVILGSGDIGLIMARRMTLEGAKVKGVFEVMKTSNGLKRNIEQCLNDFGIPLYFSKTVICIHGKDRVEGVTVASVDDNLDPIKGTEEYIPCDTLLLSVGLIPENEITAKAGISMNSKTSGPIVGEDFQTDMPGVFACGNVLRVYDLVDNVTKDSVKAGKNAVDFVNGFAYSNKNQ